jgi:ElaB/YqjD/DUF883 family membrane-anchored ribosome-binding protein
MGTLRDLLEAFDPPARLDYVDDEIERLRARLEDLGDEARSKGRRGYRAARRRIPSEGRRLKRELVRMEQAAGSALSDRPFQSVLAAFGLGLLIAALIGFGSRGKR